MKITDWNVINADDTVIDSVTTSLNNRKAASEKLKYRYGESACFLKLAKAGDREVFEGSYKQYITHQVNEIIRRGGT